MIGLQTGQLANWQQGKEPQPIYKYPTEISALLVDDKMLFAGIGNMQQFTASPGGIYCQTL